MRKGKTSVYPCFGGPLDGLMVTHDYAGSSYLLYNQGAGSKCHHSAILVFEPQVALPYDRLPRWEKRARERRKEASRG